MHRTYVDIVIFVWIKYYIKISCETKKHYFEFHAYAIIRQLRTTLVTYRRPYTVNADVIGILGWSQRAV